MKTNYAIFRPGHASAEWHEIDWPEDPGYDRIKALISPLLDGAPLEHVTVLYEDRRADMFVDEKGHVKAEPLQRNDRATEIYRANWLKHHPKDDPETLPWIAGVAVLFDRIVWM
jgi:hypothetical protein